MMLQETLHVLRAWPLKYRWLAFSGGILIVLLLIYGFRAWFLGLENVAAWDVATELHEKQVTIPVFSDGTFTFSADSPVYYVTERYLPGLVRPNRMAAFVLFFSTLTGLVFILSGSFRLKGLWFLGGVVLTGAVLMGFRLENILLQTRQFAFLVAFGLTGGLYYLLNSRRHQTDVPRVFLLFSGLFVILSGLFFYLGKVNEPVMSVASYGLLSLLAVSAVFIFWIAHGLMAGVVWVISGSSSRGQNALPRFLLFAVIFLLNALLIYLENAKRIEESVLILHPLVLYALLLLVGFAAVRQWTIQATDSPFGQTILWVYVGLAIISSATLAFVYATANDSLREAVEDYISITHLSVALAFFIHVLVNFQALFRQGLDVSKVLYKPPFSRLILARLGAFFLMIVFFAYSNFYIGYQGMAGYYNAIGDYYLAEGDLSGAETFYKESTHYESLNHKANFTLASMALGQNDQVNAGFFFRQALERRPSAMAYAGLSRSLENEDMFFDALFTLQKGVRSFPDDSRLLTNMAYFHRKARLADSSLYYIEAARSHCSDCKTENTNFLAFWIENGKPDRLKEMSALVSTRKYTPFTANRVAVDRILNIRDDSAAPVIRPDSALDAAGFALLYDLGTRSEAGNINPGLFARLRQKEANISLQEDLTFAEASTLYFSGKKTEGLKQLSILEANALKNRQIYARHLGLWFLREGVYDKAVEYMKRVGDTTSLRLMEEHQYRESLDSKLELQADALTEKGVSADNFEELLNKAPLNPYLVEKITSFLTSVKEDTRAYNIVFYATELNPSSTLLWKLYVNKSLDLGRTTYAETGLDRLKVLMPVEEYVNFRRLYELKKAEKYKEADDF